MEQGHSLWPFDYHGGGAPGSLANISFGSSIEGTPTNDVENSVIAKKAKMPFRMFW